MYSFVKIFKQHPQKFCDRISQYMIVTMLLQYALALLHHENT